MKGWIPLYRQIQDHWLWDADEPFDRRSAWIDLLLLANHETVKRVEGNKLCTYPQGTVCRSMTSLAERWGWSRKKVRNFLQLLESDHMVEVKGTTQGTTISIVNYSVYALQGPTQDTTQEHQKTSAGTQTIRNKNTTTNYLSNYARARGDRVINIHG